MAGVVLFGALPLSMLVIWFFHKGFHSGFLSPAFHPSVVGMVDENTRRGGVPASRSLKTKSVTDWEEVIGAEGDDGRSDDGRRGTVTR